LLQRRRQIDLLEIIKIQKQDFHFGEHLQPFAITDLIVGQVQIFQRNKLIQSRYPFELIVID